jgi:putative membrane protein
MNAMRNFLKILLIIYTFYYPWGLLFISLDLLPPQIAWFGSLFLIMLGTIIGTWLVVNYGRYGIVASLLILVLSWLLEHIGVVTGFPFGIYHYTDVLIPRVGGSVPLAMAFAWLLVVATSIGVTERLLQEPPEGQPLPSPPTQPAVRPTRVAKPLKIAIAASFVTLLDIVLEPAVTQVTGYWRWEEEIYTHTFYGVPLSNFIAWWVAAAFFVWLLLSLQERAVRARNAAFPTQPFERMMPWLPTLLYLLLLGQFFVINLTHGNLIAALIGGIVLAYIIFEWVRPHLFRAYSREEGETR